MFQNDFHFVAIATDKMTDGEEVFAEMKKNRNGGMPWMAILNGDGQELVTSVGPQGNIGCPVADFEIAHFVEMIRKSSDSSAAHLEGITKALQDNAAKIQAGRN